MLVAFVICPAYRGVDALGAMDDLGATVAVAVAVAVALAVFGAGTEGAAEADLTAGFCPVALSAGAGVGEVAATAVIVVSALPGVTVPPDPVDTFDSPLIVRARTTSSAGTMLSPVEAGAVAMGTPSAWVGGAAGVAADAFAADGAAAISVDVVAPEGRWPAPAADIGAIGPGEPTATLAKLG